MIKDEIEIHGAAELLRQLQDLPVKIEKNISRGALRAGARVIEREAKTLVPVETGKLRDSIQVSAGAKKNGTVYAHVRAGSRQKGGGGAFYAHMVEFGTEPHEIKPRRFGSLFLAGIFRKVVKHPGAKPRAFMRTAFDNMRGAAVEVIGQYIRERLAKVARPK